jgi:hypothetical protein
VLELRISTAALAALVLLAGGAARAADEAPPESGETDLSDRLAAARAAAAPLDLLLTRAELGAVIRDYEARTGVVLTAPIEDVEVLVTAPGVRAPMRDPSQDVGGGILAPFWALLHPKDAWRIFVPIPPRGERKDERPAPDPR